MRILFPVTAVIVLVFGSVGTHLLVTAKPAEPSFSRDHIHLGRQAPNQRNEVIASVSQSSVPNFLVKDQGARDFGAKNFSEPRGQLATDTVQSADNRGLGIGLAMRGPVPMHNAPLRGGAKTGMNGSKTPEDVSTQAKTAVAQNLGIRAVGWELRR